MEVYVWQIVGEAIQIFWCGFQDVVSELWLTKDAGSDTMREMMAMKVKRQMDLTEFLYAALNNTPQYGIVRQEVLVEYDTRLTC